METPSLLFLSPKAVFALSCYLTKHKQPSSFKWRLFFSSQKGHLIEIHEEWAVPNISLLAGQRSGCQHLALLEAEGFLMINCQYTFHHSLGPPQEDNPSLSPLASPRNFWLLFSWFIRLEPPSDSGNEGAWEAWPRRVAEELVMWEEAERLQLRQSLFSAGDSSVLFVKHRWWAPHWAQGSPWAHGKMVSSAITIKIILLRRIYHHVALTLC